MAKEIFMPKLSSTMETGTLLQWFKEEGDQVAVGDPVFEIMTDKINIEVEAYEEGILLKRYYGVDEEVPVNGIVGYIGKKGEEVPEQPGETPEDPAVEKAEEKEAVIENTSSPEVEASSDKKVRATPAARKKAGATGVPLHTLQGSGPNGRIHKKDVEVSGQQQERVTPLAEKVAADKGVDLAGVQGSGPNGKIYRRDVELPAEEVPAAETTSTAYEGTRRFIGDRMQQSSSEIPHVTLNTEIDASVLKKMRTELLPVIEKKTGKRLSYNDILVKALGEVLISHPQVNATFENNSITLHQKAHIGIAVAADFGLMVPVLRDVEKKSLSLIVQESKELAAKAREGRTRPDDMKQGTFTISNLGMYAVDHFNPIINQPQAAILGVGRLHDKVIAVNGTAEVRPVLSLSLSFDHRIIDGAPAAAFLTELKEKLESPYQLLI
ncbi:dihydrolipoamide acetyltransferase family protein [Sinobaca sp. H24]|uniref:dihydrolipoamide acetyltransferase family protein n=1 Tax=Sinobaca sp. H24 TaxID=2923376 RepID=UPI00207970A8|nr:dihydrolipoamide acetyltransferase family protein [Sinobaca sp. H24]